jgi:CBS domain containing-hemolysin-like protein
LQFFLEVLIILALIGLNGLLSMAEIALVSSRRVRLQPAADEGDAGAIAALAVAREPTRFLSTVQIGITLVGIVAGAFAGTRLAQPVDDWLQGLGVDESISDPVSFVGVLLATTYLSLVFGELVPKRIGLHRPERIATLTIRPMALLSRAATPIVALLTASTTFVVRLLGISSNEESAITEDDLRLMIGMTAESGTVAEEEAELLDRVFHFGDRRVHEVMIPRTEAVWLESGTSLTDFYRVYSRTPHSRFPVFDDNPDKVIGILGIKDVLAALAQGSIETSAPVDRLLRPPFFVPETKPIGELFREMQANGVQMAIAVDEWGGTAGIVTLEQLIEEMVGPVHDELRPAEQEIQTIDERTTRVDGGLSIEEAREELGLEIPEGPYDTIAGFVLSELGRIPQEGEQLPYDGYRITVEEMRGPKIQQLRFTKLEAPAGR